MTVDMLDGLNKASIARRDLVAARHANGNGSEDPALKRLKTEA